MVQVEESTEEEEEEVVDEDEHNHQHEMGQRTHVLDNKSVWEIICHRQ